MHPAPHLRVAILTLVLLAVAPIVAFAQAATLGASVMPPEPPTQPATGPGGSVPAYDGLLAQHFGPDPASATVPTGYWLFEPTRPRAGVAPLVASRLPLVLFAHAFRGGNPEL